MLHRLGADTFEVRQLSDWQQPKDGVILPGGESTVQLRLLRELQLFEPLRQDILNGLADKASNEGMVVSISAGNAYDLAYRTNAKNLYKEDIAYHTGGSPGTFVNSLCVAAAQNTLTKGTPMEFNGNQDVYYYESTEGSDGTSYTNPALTTIVGTYNYVYIDAAG